MPFSFITDEFPNVKVFFTGKIKTDEEFNQFTNSWLSLYYRSSPFTMIFDTTHMKIPELKYSIKLSQFIKTLKRKNPQYLKQSFIIIKKKIVIMLLDFIFLLQPPVAPVHLIKRYPIDNDLSNIKIIKTYYPRKTRNI